MNEQEEFDRANRMAEDDEEIARIFEDYKKSQEEGSKNILKYFDRIHDKLFTFNNIMIAGFFGLSKIDNSVSVITILIPITNLIILIYVEYRMMEKSRFELKILTKKPDEIKLYGHSIIKTNQYSLVIIFTTVMVTGFFLYYLIFQ